VLSCEWLIGRVVHVQPEHKRHSDVVIMKSMARRSLYSSRQNKTASVGSQFNVSDHLNFLFSFSCINFWTVCLVKYYVLLAI
jgi:hypothetical protein